MPKSNRSVLDRLLTGLGRVVTARPWLWLLLVVVICAASLDYCRTHLGINTDTSGMLSSDLPFLKDRARMEAAFPQDASAILLLIEADTPELADHAVEQLGEALRADPSAFQSVYIPSEEPFFKQQALLFLEPAELEQLADKLAEAQPFIGRLAKNNSLTELFSILQQAVQQSATVEVKPLLDQIRITAQSLQRGERYQISWQQLMLGDQSPLSRTQRFILIKPQFDFSELVPTEPALIQLRAVVEQVQQQQSGVAIHISGEVAMEYDELQSLSNDTTIAGIASMILVCGCLMLGLRSFTLMCATLVTLISGLILSAGFAALAVGAINLISIAFAVLYIGLGVDYAIHLCLRYREMMLQNYAKQDAIIGAMRTIGPSLMLCAGTTSIGFFAFIPTDYTGVSELGLIAGVSMFIGLTITLTLLPALLTILPTTPRREIKPLFTLPQGFYNFPLHHQRAIRWSALLLALVALLLVSRVTFDVDPTNLRDPHSDSVVTFKKLLKQRESSPFTLSLLAENQQRISAITQRLTPLASVDKVVSLFDFIPQQQPIKLAMIDELALLLGFQIEPFSALQQSDVETRMIAIKALILTLNRAIETAPPGSAETMIQLSDQLYRLINQINNAPEAEKKRLLDQFESGLLETLPFTMNRLFDALEATPIDRINDLPASIIERWRSQDGLYKVQIIPAEDLNQVENLKAFVADVQALEPHATDLPVIYLESAKTAVAAFVQALVSALVAIILILLLVLRSLRAMLSVLLPLLLAAVMTGAATVLFNIPFNFANIIALPLLLGLGVDSGIHMIQRLRESHDQVDNLLHNSTTRGIFFSALTTLLSFGSLAFIAHAGTASMGQLLTIGILFTLLATLIVLPALAVNRRQLRTDQQMNQSLSK